MLRLIHFTPLERSAWRWIFVRPLEVVPAGPQVFVPTGETVNVPYAVQVWGGVPGLPTFPDRATALKWCEDTGTIPDAVDIE